MSEPGFLGNAYIDADYIRHLLHYDPLTGEWTWMNPLSRTQRRGDRAGTTRRDGRRQIRVDGNTYLASRLAWLYMTGVWPQNEIDHHNRIKGDDRWENLRDATHSQNMYNRDWCERSGEWRGICTDGNQFRVIIGNEYLGHFPTFEEAKTARDTALKDKGGAFVVITNERKVV